MRIIFAGGGTGGHVYIGISLAREMLRRDPSTEIVFVGTERGLESRIVPREGFRLETIVSRGLMGMRTGEFLRNLAIVPGSLLQSRSIVRRENPEIVVGVGGYSSGPVVLAAWWLGKATMIVEPNAHPGLTNRWLARVVDAAALAMPDTGGFFGSKAAVTGIPVRTEFAQIPPYEGNKGRLTLLIYGGSQGSHALNTIVCGALPEIRELGGKVHLIHQTGEMELEQVRTAYRNASMDAEVHAFLPQIYEELAEADLVLARAGAGTVAELTVAGRASILVPLPGAADDHQRKNAEALQAEGAAKMIEEKELTPARLVSEVRAFLEHRDELRNMAAAARRLARPEAARSIADLIQKLAPRAGR